MTAKYNKNDNDTYLEILSTIPAFDVEAHMFRDPAGRVMKYGIMGHFTSESGKKAGNSVLRFPKASSIGLIAIKSIKLLTAMPLSLISRYKIKADGVLYCQSTTVFFDPAKEKFMLIMDSRFLRDIKFSELSPMLEGDFAKFLKIYPDKEGQLYLAIEYDSIESMRKDNSRGSDGRIGCLEAALKSYVLHREKGEKVIIVRFTTDNETPSFLKTRGTQISCEGVHVSSLKIEACVAFKFDDRYYISRNGETFCQSDSIYIDKPSYQSDPHKKDNSTYFTKSERPGLLILPYSDEQFEFLMKIQGRLKSLNDDTYNFLNGFAQNGCDIDHMLVHSRELLLGIK